MKGPIGIFDSGVGGISVLKAIRERLPQKDLIYIADSQNLPYGDKRMDEIFAFSRGITDFLIGQGCKIIVIACNTASAAALKKLRELYADTIFVGMEPAVKPAAEQSSTKVVGVIATVATFQGELFHGVVERYAKDVTVLNQPCPGLVQQIEAGLLDTSDTEDMLRKWLQPMIDKGMDELVLACTHYPFVMPLLKKICGEKVNIIDPAPAVARQVERVNSDMGPESHDQNKGRTVYYSTVEATLFKNIASNVGIHIEHAASLNWKDGLLYKQD